MGPAIMFDEEVEDEVFNVDVVLEVDELLIASVAVVDGVVEVG